MKSRERPNPSSTYRWVVRLVRPLLVLATRRNRSGSTRLPTGGFIAVSNHISDADSVTVVHLLLDHGIYPRILAKDSLFRAPVLGWILRRCDLIPVRRGSADATSALDMAAEALQEGHCVLLYPEGTHTFDPQLWPMTGKTGAARLALRTGVPVIPMSQWGPQEFKSAHSPRMNLRALPVPAQIHVGRPVALGDLAGVDEPATAQEATRRIMAALTDGVAHLRGRTPPARPYDRRWGRVRDDDPDSQERQG